MISWFGAAPSIPEIGAGELLGAVAGLALAVAGEMVRLQRDRLQRRRGRRRTRRQDRRSPGQMGPRPRAGRQGNGNVSE